MIRANPKHAVEPLWHDLTTTLERQGVLPRLARRLAMQVVLKIDAGALSERATWRAIGSQIAQETERLRTGIGLVDRQMIVALPKLSADDIEALLESLTRREPSI